MPEDVAAVVFCGKATQASLPTADIGTQCAVAYLTSAGCQTEPELPETEVHPFQFLAPFGGVPEWAKMAVEGALADRRRGHPTCSCCPHFSNTRWLQGRAGRLVNRNGRVIKGTLPVATRLGLEWSLMPASPVRSAMTKTQMEPCTKRGNGD
ncbi:uncharacterized protein LOC144158108 [Haemaphysalis longicornis]